MDALLLVYPTYDSEVRPRLVSLERNFTDEQFVVFVTALAAALNETQGGHDHTRMTVAVMVRDTPGWMAAAAFELA